MKDKEYMQIYCAALTGLIAAQGRNDLLTESHVTEMSLEDWKNQTPEFEASCLKAENIQMDLIYGLTDVAKLIANSALSTLEMD